MGKRGDKCKAIKWYMLLTDFTWVQQEGLTLLGDTAYLMAPFAGEGVNCAMLDALELFKALTSCF